MDLFQGGSTELCLSQGKFINPKCHINSRKKINLAVLHFLVDFSSLKIEFCWLWTCSLLKFVVNPNKIILQNIYPFKSFQIYDWILHEPTYFDWYMHYPFMLDAQSLTWKWPNLDCSRSDWLQTSVELIYLFIKIILRYWK